MANISFQCPHCKQEIQAPAKWSGKTVSCPACKKSVPISMTGAKTPAEPKFTIREPGGAATTPSGTQSVSAQPIAAKPVAARPVVAKPVAAKPVVARPVVARPVVAQPVNGTPAKPAQTKDEATKRTSLPEDSNSGEGRTGHWKIWSTVRGVVFLLLVIGGVCLWLRHRHFRQCRENFKLLSDALLRYEKSNHHLPRQLGQLTRYYGKEPSCPAGGATIQLVSSAAAKWLNELADVTSVPVLVCSHGRRGLVLFADGRIEVIKGKKQLQELLTAEIATVQPEEPKPTAPRERPPLPPANGDKPIFQEWIEELKLLHTFVKNDVIGVHFEIDANDIASAQARASCAVAEFFFDFFMSGVEKASGIERPAISDVIKMTQLEQVVLFEDAQKRLDTYISETASKEYYQKAIEIVRKALHENQTTQYVLAREHYRQAALGFLKAYAVMDAIDPEGWGVTYSYGGNTWWTLLWDEVMPLYGELFKEEGYYLTKYFKEEIVVARPQLTKEYCAFLREAAEQILQEIEEQAATEFQTDASEQEKSVPEALLLKVRQRIVRLEVVEQGGAADLQKRVDERELEFLLSCCKQARANRDWLLLRQFGRSLCKAEPDLLRPVLDEKSGQAAIEEGEREYRAEVLALLEQARTNHQWELACEKAVALQEIAPDLGEELLAEIRHQWANDLVKLFQEMTDWEKMAKTLVKVFNLDSENALGWECEAKVVAELGDSFTTKVLLNGQEVPATLSFDEAGATWSADEKIPGFCWGDKFLLSAHYSEDGVEYEANVRVVIDAVGPSELEALTLKADAFIVPLADGSKMRLEKISSGKFQMGSAANALSHFRDEPLHQVRLTDDFWLGQYEVTQAQWFAVMGTNPSQRGRYDDCPVDTISWEEAKEFCEALNNNPDIARPAGYFFALPTEAQWEYACRAGTTTDLNNGKQLSSFNGADDQLHQVGWYQGNSFGETHPVGQKEPNAWGLYDMHGNVSEMCRDNVRLYNGYVCSNACDTVDCTNPVGTDGYLHIVRGGSWLNAPRVCRSAHRETIDYLGQDGIGFRLALVKR